ncbi:helix-turn-helix domain-containing protein, partial [Salmonella enterica]|nr:helix-turn-helix domain-containing protein [Salmonella enterica]
MNNSVESVFQRRLKEVLNKLGYSQSELARRMGVTPQAVQRWCNGLGEPRKSALEKLSSATNMPAHWFFTPYEEREDRGLYINTSFSHADELHSSAKPVLLSPDEEQLINIYRDLPGEERKNMLRVFSHRLKEINDFIEKFLRHSHENK